MKDITDLKNGDKLYNLEYYSSGREMQIVIVKKANKRYVTLKGGYEWNVTAKMFNTEFFTTKKECYQQSLKLHRFRLDIKTQESNELRQEIRYLNKQVNKK